MSKLADIKRMQFAAGDPSIFSAIGSVVGGIAKFVKKGLAKVPAGVKTAAGTAASIALPLAASNVLTRGSAPALPRARGGATGSFGGRRRGKGITARELSGFRKVSRLLANVGMAPRHLHRAYSPRRKR